MGTNARVLTQNELLALNSALQELAANLNIHVNDSISVAHGLNGEIAVYCDSAGDQWGNVVLTFEFGTPPNVTRMYVPAQITSLGPASTSDGLVTTSSASVGSYAYPGVPLGKKSLVTDMTSESETKAITYDNMLLAHAATVHSDTGASQCHGGRTYTVGNVLDSLGHVIGRKYITLGINGTAWKIPCDEYRNQDGTFGVPQLMRGINLLANRTNKDNTALCKQPKPQLAGFWLTAPTGGSQPYTVNWEVNYAPDGSSPNWTAMGSAIPPLPGAGWVLASTTKELYFDASISNQIVLRSMERKDKRYQQQCTIRARIENAAGSVYTNYCRFYACEPEEDDCWFDEIFGTDWFTDVESNNQSTRNETIPGSPPLQP